VTMQLAYLQDPCKGGLCPFAAPLD